MNFNITKIDNGYLLQTNYPTNNYYYGYGYPSQPSQKYYGTLDELLAGIKTIEQNTQQGSSGTLTITTGNFIGETTNG